MEKYVSKTLEQNTLSSVGHLMLEEYLTKEKLCENLPLPISLDSNQISFDNITFKHSNDVNLINSNIELVAFSDLTVAGLMAIQLKANITIQSLNTTNNRNNATSYRFSVKCEDFASSRKLVAEFSLNNNIELALLQNAPSLEKGGLLVMDMDSTTIEIECIDEIAKLAGTGEQVSKVTELAMEGKLDFAQSLHQRVATLANASVGILEEVARDIPLMPGLETLIKELKKSNWRIAIASGGFTYFADHLQNLLSLDAAHANELEIVNGKLTGKVLGNVVDAQAKADCLLNLAKKYQIEHNQTVAMGDGANDLVMMEAASFGVAFHAKPIVLAQADSSINHKGLDCLLHWLA